MPISRTRYGNQYIKDFQFSLTHGATPSTCELLTESQSPPAWGQDIIVEVGNSTWRGRIIDVQDIKGEGKGLISRFRAIDYRDDLFAVLFFGQINMIDQNTGEIYNISEDIDPDGWQWQIPIYGHVYARDLIEVIAAKANMTCQFSTATLARLSSVQGDDWINSRYNVFNLDWNNGIKCSAALTQVCERLGIQFTILMNTQQHILRFTVIGEPDLSIEWEGFFAAETVSGNAIQPDVDTGVYIVGDRNLYEYDDLPLVPAWNQTLNEYALDEDALYDALEALGLSIISDKVSDLLPAGDPNFIEFGKPFGNMILKDYFNTVPFKVYRIQSDILLQYMTQDEYDGVRQVRQDVLSTPLLSDPGTPFTVKCSHRDEKKKTPKNPLQVSQLIKEKRSGITIREKTGHVIFDNWQYKLSAEQLLTPTPELEWEDVIVDTPTISCVFFGPIYRNFFGTLDRVGSKQVSALRIAKVAIPATGIPEDVGEFTYPGEKTADVSAEDVAISYLARPQVVHSGEETFIGTAGHFPNGEINRISVSASDGPGIVERVSYSNDEPALEFDPQIELNRKIGVDQIAREKDKVRTDRRIDDLKKLQAEAVLSEKGLSPVQTSALLALNKGNYIKIKNPEGQVFEAGDPIIAVPNVDKDFVALPQVEIDAEDTRVTGILMRKSRSTRTLNAITAGIAQANVEGPVVVGDQLVLNQSTGRLKKGDGGNLTALKNQPDTLHVRIPVRFGGGGSSGGGSGGGNTSVRYASTDNNTNMVTGPIAIDGFTTVVGDTVLLKDQTTPSQNGPWTVGYSRNVIQKERTANVATLTTSVAHGISVGQTFFVNNISGGFNGTIVITEIPSTTQFSYANVGADVPLTADAGTVSQAWARLGTLTSGMLVSVRTGKVNAGTVFELTTEAPIVADTTSLAFHKVNNDVAHRATAASISFAALTGTAVSIDGAVATINQIILVKNCTTPANNGLYRVQTGAWLYIGQPSYVFVLAGTRNIRTVWLLTATDTYSRWLADGSMVVATAGTTGAPSGGTIDGITIVAGNRVLRTTGGTGVAGAYVYDGAAYLFEETFAYVGVQRGSSFGRRIWAYDAVSQYLQTRGVYA